MTTKGRGSKTVLNDACNLVIEEGAIVFLVDKSAKGAGDQLYGSRKKLASYLMFIMYLRVIEGNIY